MPDVLYNYCRRDKNGCPPIGLARLEKLAELVGYTGNLFVGSRPAPNKPGRPRKAVV